MFHVPKSSINSGDSFAFERPGHDSIPLVPRARNRISSVLRAFHPSYRALARKTSVSNEVIGVILHMNIHIYISCLPECVDPATNNSWCVSILDRSLMKHFQPIDLFIRSRVRDNGVQTSLEPGCHEHVKQTTTVGRHAWAGN